MILITGHFGFVGQHLASKLNGLGIEWCGIDNKGFGVTNGDIRNEYDLECAFELNQVTQVVHLAALAGVRRSKLYPAEYISTNVLGTQNVVNMCKKYGARMINFSSSSVYGNLKELPAVEDSPKNPTSLYGITKLAAEQIVKNAFLGIEALTLRPFTIYGENGRKDEVIYKWLEQIKANKPITIYGNPEESCRGYVYVGDLVNVVAQLLQKENWDYGVNDFNIGGSEVIYLNDILNLFLEQFKGKVSTHQLERPKEDVVNQYADISRAKKLLGYVPKPRFIENVKKILKEEVKKRAGHRCIDPRDNITEIYVEPTLVVKFKSSFTIKNKIKEL